MQILTNLLDMTELCYVIAEDGGHIIGCHRDFKEMFHLSDQDLHNKTIDDVLPGRSLEAISRYQLQDSQQEIVVKYKTILSESNQQLQVLLLEPARESPLPDALFRNIYQQVLMSLEEGIEVFDKNGNLLFCNLSHAKLDEINIQELLGKHLTEIYALDRSTSPLLQMLETGKPIYNYFVEYTNCKGKTNSVICDVQPITDDQQVIGGVVVTRDFTKSKQMLETILDLQKQLMNKTLNPPVNMLTGFDNILGRDPALLAAIKWAKIASETPSPVLIYGETGTGKEIFARTIHENSCRANKPFLAINCAALPENLLESILFGTVKGAFTGAIDQKGLFEQADKGTLLLDELNSMPINLQSKLLRVLEEKKVRRLGDKAETPIDVRIIASCNIEPDQAIKNGQLRNDIFYRLAVIYIAIPPLRHRINDLKVFTDSLIQEYNKYLNKNVIDINHDVHDLFYNYAWPGNVRQLKHCLECAMIAIPREDKYINRAHLPNYLMESNKTGYYSDSKVLVVDKIDKTELNRIMTALKKSNGNIAKASRDLGISRQRLQYWLKKLSITIQKVEA